MDAPSRPATTASDRAAIRALLAGALVVLFGVPAVAQIRDQVIVLAQDLQAKQHKVYRFDRKLQMLGATDPSAEGHGGLEMRTPVAVDGSGLYWIAFEPLSTKKLLRMAPAGSLLTSTLLEYNPVGVLASEGGTVYALTRIPLQLPGKLHAVAPGGSVLWSSWDAPSLYTKNYPEHIIATPSGEIWLAGPTQGPTGLLVPYPLVTRLDPVDGSVLESVALPWLTQPENFTNVAHLAGAPDGTMWLRANSWNTPTTFFHMNGVTTLAAMPQPLAASTWDGQVRVDAAGNVLAVSSYSLWSELVVFSGVDLSVLASHDLGFDHGARILSFALGPTGEDVIAITQEVFFDPEPETYRIVRLNLVTGMRSTRLLPDLGVPAVPNGDPTGFIHANVVDQAGDNDGDGASNRAEVLAGSNPYDETSRPEGPKVYLSFLPSSNALVLRYVDPNGLLDPVGGLDAATLSVTIGPYGNVFWFLLPFATALDLSADGTQATLTFGALPLPLDRKWQVEATVADYMGAVGWDWQVTPPGDL